ncbi:hypothetical protein [Hymenobacter siberiensis]|uniref:hypothetical protein n=1 Tax=Hymenobacter siberiensis TaxID=2848396 RepID=UPI001C1E25DD|nr:hypothetical protein [Hymenobacter siberiensis]
MKHAYPWAQPLLAALISFTALSASAQQAWRPFRPGLIYSFSPTSSSASNGTANVFLLRLDSTYRTAGGDSVWAFNRLMWPFDGSALGGNVCFYDCP